MEIDVINSLNTVVSFLRF